MKNYLNRILESIRILFLRTRGYRPLDGSIPEAPPKKVRMFGGVVDPKRTRIIEILKERGGFKPFLSIFNNEQQRQKGLETMRCTIQGELAKISAVFNLCIEYKLFDESNIKWLKDTGYIVNGKFNSSERYIAKLSFTSKNGNLDSRVLATIHQNGLVPESMCKWEDWMKTWNQYYCPIDKELIYNIGYEFKKRFEFYYKLVYVPEFKDALETTSPIGTYVDGYYKIVNGVVQRSNRMSNHKICLYGIDDLNRVQDSYVPFEKKFVKDYPFFAGSNFYTGKKYSYGYKITFLENIIKKKMIKTIKQKNRAEIYAIDEEGGKLFHIGGEGSYKIFKDSLKFEPHLEVDNILLYLKSKYKKSFTKCERIGVMK